MLMKINLIPPAVKNIAARLDAGTRSKNFDLLMATPASENLSESHDQSVCGAARYSPFEFRINVKADVARSSLVGFCGKVESRFFSTPSTMFKHLKIL